MKRGGGVVRSGNETGADLLLPANHGVQKKWLKPDRRRRDALERASKSHGRASTTTGDSEDDREREMSSRGFHEQ
jgi:hypothetical protein